MPHLTFECEIKSEFDRTFLPIQTNYTHASAAQNDETIAKVLALANALETTRFGDFWALATGSSKDVASLGTEEVYEIEEV